MKIYFAGPLFTAAEILWNKKIADELRKLNYNVFLPQEAQSGYSTQIFERDRDNIDSADVVVAIMDGPDPDSGTCWEFGYAYAKGKRLVAVRTDLRTIKDLGEPFNLMLSKSADRIINWTSSNPRTLARSIDWAIQDLG